MEEEVAPAPAEVSQEEGGMQRPFHTYEADEADISDETDVGKRRIQVYANILVDAVRRQVWRPQIKMGPIDVDAILVLVHAKGGRSSVFWGNCMGNSDFSDTFFHHQPRFPRGCALRARLCNPCGKFLSPPASHKEAR